LKSMLSILGGFLTAVLVIGFALCLSVNSLIDQYGNNYILSPDKVPNSDVIIIPGAKVNQDGTPSNSLQYRLDLGYELYEKGCAKKILVSGDQNAEYYDEVNVMCEYLKDLGVPAEDIFLDHKGIDTYHTMYRAQKVYGVTNAIVVSQHYHNVRAVYIGRQLGMAITAVDAKDSKTVSMAKMTLREYGARFKAFIQAGILKPEPKELEDPISIFSDGTITQNQ